MRKAKSINSEKESLANEVEFIKPEINQRWVHGHGTIECTLLIHPFQQPSPLPPNKAHKEREVKKKELIGFGNKEKIEERKLMDGQAFNVHRS